MNSTEWTDKLIEWMAETTGAEAGKDYCPYVDWSQLNDKILEMERDFSAQSPLEKLMTRFFTADPDNIDTDLQHRTNCARSRSRPHPFGTKCDCGLDEIEAALKELAK